MVDVAYCLEQASDMAAHANAQYKDECGEDSVLAAAAQILRATAPNWRIPACEGEIREGDVLPPLDGDFVDMSMIDFSDDIWQNGIFNF